MSIPQVYKLHAYVHVSSNQWLQHQLWGPTFTAVTAVAQFVPDTARCAESTPEGYVLVRGTLSRASVQARGVLAAVSEMARKVAFFCANQKVCCPSNIMWEDSYLHERARKPITMTRSGDVEMLTILQSQ
jgi:hypothetical protein